MSKIKKRLVSVLSAAMILSAMVVPSFAAPEPKSTDFGQKVADTARSYTNKGYKYGNGWTLTKSGGGGIDCIRFAIKMYEKAGSKWITQANRSKCFPCERIIENFPDYRVKIPGKPKKATPEMKPGDILLIGDDNKNIQNYKGNWSLVRHVVIYLGNGQVAHAASPRNGVCTGTVVGCCHDARYVKYVYRPYPGGEQTTPEPPQHVHKPVLAAGQAATCETAGYKDCYKCECGKYFADAEGKTEIPDIKAWQTGEGKIEPLGHDWGEWETVKEATATEDGLEKRVCKREGCGKEETRVIPAKQDKPDKPDVKPDDKPDVPDKPDVKPDTPDDKPDKPDVKPAEGLTAVEEVAPTCTETGCKAYYEDQNKHKFYADKEGKNEIKDLEAWKNDEGKIDALGHDWGEWEVTKEATDTEDGLAVRKCKRDPSHTESRVIPKSGKLVTVEYDLNGGEKDQLKSTTEQITVIDREGMTDEEFAKEPSNNRKVPTVEEFEKEKLVTPPERKAFNGFDVVVKDGEDEKAETYAPGEEYTVPRNVDSFVCRYVWKDADNAAVDGDEDNNGNGNADIQNENGTPSENGTAADDGKGDSFFGPKTGDSANLAIFFCVFAIASITAGIICSDKRRQKKQ